MRSLFLIAILASACASAPPTPIAGVTVVAVDPNAKGNTLGEVSDAVDCGSASVDARFVIPQCTQGPCPLTKDVQYEVYPLFTASANIADIRVRVTLTHPGGTATLVDGVVADANLQQGTEYRITYQLALPVLYEYQDAHLKFEVLNAANDNLEVCIGADVIVTEADITDVLYLDVTIGGEETGRVIVGLFGNVVPLTARNFATICTDGINGRSYSGVRFHRVIRAFMIQGGDIVNGDGTGSTSIYGPQFDDENFILNHRGPGYLSMANAGPNTNGCQFFITTVVTPWLDGGYVVFGRVLRGQEFVHAIENNPTDSADRPILPALIRECGRIPTN